MDFGLAKALDTAPQGDPSQSPTLTAAATQMGVILGTAAYMSPEQARGKAVDKRTDVWAFGCVLYEVLTGSKPFPGDDVSQTLARVIDRDPDWDALPESLPPALGIYARQCLRKDPRQRVRDIGDMRLAIEGAFDVAPTSSGAPVAEVAGSTLWRWSAVGTIVVLAALLLWQLSGPNDGVVQRTRHAAVQLPEGARWAEGRSVTVSADGQTLVFRLETGGTQLYRRQINEVAVHPIPGSDDAVWPILSPDGQAVAFFRGGELQRMSIRGGVATTICQAPGSPLGGTWGTDGTIVYATVREGIMQVAVEGGAPESLVTRESGEYLLAPAVLPDHDVLLFTFTEDLLLQGRRPIEAVNLVTGSRSVVTEGHSPAYSDTGHLLFQTGNTVWADRFDPDELRLEGNSVPVLSDVRQTNLGSGQYHLSEDGTLLYAPVLQSAETQLVWLDHDGQVVERAVSTPLRQPSSAFTVATLRW